MYVDACPAAAASASGSKCTKELLTFLLQTYVCVRHEERVRTPAALAESLAFACLTFACVRMYVCVCVCALRER